MLDFIFPSPCLLCDKNGKPICSTCLNSLELHLDKTERNGLEIYHLTPYGSEIGKIITAIKEKGLTALIAEVLRQKSWPDSWLDVWLVPIPSAPQNELKRGFAHTEILARKLAAKYQRLSVKNILRSKTRRLDQAGLSQRQRKENLVQAFDCRLGITSSKPLVLIDDVYTTGATMASAREALEAAGFVVLGGWVIALVDSPKSA